MVITLAIDDNGVCCFCAAFQDTMHQPESCVLQGVSTDESANFSVDCRSTYRSLYWLNFAQVSVVRRYSLLVNSRVAGWPIVARYFIDGSLTDHCHNYHQHLVDVTAQFSFFRVRTVLKSP